MSKYLCVECSFNNNGWCKQKQMNGLKKLNIQKCESFKRTGTTLVLKRGAKDYYGQQMVEVRLNNASVEIPMPVLKDFIQNNARIEMEVTIKD